MKTKDDTKPVLDTHNRITHTELEQLIKLQLNQIWEDPESVYDVPPIYIHGSPGIGKSACISNICKELGIEYIDFRASQCESVDIRGLPVPNREKKCMDWYVNGVWPQKKDGRGIIFLDELSAADKSCQVALYQLVLDRNLGELYQVPPGYLIIAAGNLATDRAVSTSMSSALANRFMHVELKHDQESWLTWARQNNIHPSVVGFIQYKPTLLFDMDDQNLERGWPSPRSWARVSKMCHMCKDEHLLRKAVFGLVGNGAGVEFLAFHKLNAHFANILDTMLNPNSQIVIPDEADKKYAMCAAMVYLLWRGKDEEDEQKRINGFYRICIEMSSDFASMALMAAFEGNDKKQKQEFCDKLVKHPLFIKWRAKHKDALNKHIQEFGLK